MIPEMGVPVVLLRIRKTSFTASNANPFPTQSAWSGGSKRELVSTVCGALLLEVEPGEVQAKVGVRAREPVCHGPRTWSADRCAAL